MSTDRLVIRVAPDPGSVALVRIFVGTVLSVFGADQAEAEDVKVAVSDLASSLIEAGTTMEVEAEINGAQLKLTGNLAGRPPAAGALLLGPRLEVGEERWTINLRTI